MGIVLWSVLGAIAGWIASVIMKTNTQHGLLIDIVLGTFGALVGGLIMEVCGWPGVTGFNMYSLLVAVLGAIVLIWIGRVAAH